MYCDVRVRRSTEVFAHVSVVVLEPGCGVAAAITPMTIATHTCARAHVTPQLRLAVAHVITILALLSVRCLAVIVIHLLSLRA